MKGIEIGRSGACSGPLKRHRLEFDAQRAELMDLFGVKFCDVSARVSDTPDEALALKRNQRFPDNRCAHLHLPCDFPLDDGITGFQRTFQKCILKSADDTIR